MPTSANSKKLGSKKSSSAAPGPYLGYSLEPVRLCYHLLVSAPDSFVSLEEVEDVAIHKANDELVLEQTKSALAQNPVSDWAIDLWKTVANWIDGIEAGSVDPNKTGFRLYVTPIHTGKFVEALSAAKTDDAVDEVVLMIQNERGALSKKPQCHKYLKKFLDLGVPTRREFVKNFTFESNQTDPVDVIRALVKAVVSDSMVDACCSYGIGNAKGRVDSLIRAGVTPLVNAGEFQRQFKAFVHKHDLSGLLSSLSSPPSTDRVSATLASSPIFIQQLDIVNASQEQKLRAVSDFLQSSVAKTEWADAGKIFDQSLAEFDQNLIRQHGFIRAEIEDTHTSSEPEARGRVTYARCGNSSLKLEGREVPGFFTPGCYNDLANRLELGWHPNYEVMLGNEKKK